MLFSEFLEGIGEQASEGNTYAYKVINQLYMDNKIATKLESYEYYRKHRIAFSWIDELDIGHGYNAKKSKELATVISEEKAKEIINREFGFELDKIEICGIPYFEVYDYNHIVFMVKGYSRVYSNGMLQDIYR